jgi:hypothetical protein
MCVTYCHRRQVLYWNHEDCSSQTCPLVNGPHGRCDDCRHRRGDICRLTNAPLPESGGCCHGNVALAQGLRVVTRTMLEPLGVGAEEMVAEVLERWGAPYEVNGRGQVVVDPDELGIPTVYGLGAEAVGEEAFPWPEMLW